jgi:transposase-like protein
MGAVKFTRQMTIQPFDALFPDEDACRAHLTKRRWPRGVRCPRCGGDRVYDLKTMPWKWECPDCAPKGYRFSVLVGTIFENTNVPLRTWFRAIHLMLVSKKGISALQVHRMLGFGSYRTAWYMCHRIRAGLRAPEFRKLVGIVEVDETFIGGKNKNRHRNKRTPGTGGSGKTPIAGAVNRKGNVVARVIENTDTATLTGFVREAVSTKVDLLASDENAAYRGLGEDYPHRTVRHARGEYVVGAVHTQTIDGFWSLIKRGVMGTFHKVSKKYLPLYVAEFEFRYNHRNNPDIFGAAMARC